MLASPVAKPELRVCAREPRRREMARPCCARRCSTGTALFDGWLRWLERGAARPAELVVGRGRVGEAGHLRDVVWNTLKSGGHMKDSIYKTGSSSMLHGLRAKGSAAALINSKNPMWPVAEFSRSHVLVPWSPDGEFLNLNLKALALIYGYPCK